MSTSVEVTTVHTVVFKKTSYPPGSKLRVPKNVADKWLA